MGKLHLYIPKLNELWYRQKLMGDPATMSYNKGYSLNFDGYDNDTGCIEFPQSEWMDWYERFVAHGAPDRFYAYIARDEDGIFIGEVNAHKNRPDARYDMGIVIEAAFRGKGYSEEALGLLLKYVFNELGAQEICNSFEASRTAAEKAHLSAGFLKTEGADGISEFSMPRKRFLKLY